MLVYFFWRVSNIVSHQYCGFDFLEFLINIAVSISWNLIRSQHVEMGLKRRQRIQQSFIVSRTVYIAFRDFKQ